MKTAWLSTSALAVLLAASPVRATDDAEIARLIGRLGDDAFAEREAASAALEKLGEPALPALRKALDASDAEVRRRAAELVGAIGRRLRADAVEALKKAGAVVTVDEADPARPVEKVDLSGSKTAGAALVQLKRLPEVRVLDLSSAAVTDEHLASLQAVPELRLLRLGGTAVTDAGMGRLKGLKELRLLNLEGTAVTDKGVADLEKALPDLGVVR